jgi:hypothetical protein
MDGPTPKANSTGMEWATGPAGGFALSAILAIAVVATYFSLDFLRGTSAFWIFPRAPQDHAFADMAQLFSGYLFFTTSSWSFPLLFAGNFGVPEGTNVALMDAIPVVALLSKTLFHVFGLQVNLLGAWIAACFVLTSLAFVYALTRAGVTNVVVMLAGAALVVMWPALLLRLSHMPLLAWFTFLLSFAAYLSARRDPALLRRVIWIQLALVCLALFVNVYLAFMTAFFAAVTLLQAVVDRQLTWRRALASLLMLMGGAVLTMLIIGQLSGAGAPAGSGGFGIWSLNLLSPVYPQFSGLFPDSPGVDATGGQYEGFSYLGAGVLFLLAGAVIRLALSAPSRAAVYRAARHHWVLIASCAMLTLFAASNRMFVGDWAVIDIPLPWRLTVMLGAFRSSGRYFWPVSLVLLLAVLVFWTRHARVRQPVLIAMLAAAVILQWLDTRPMRAMVAQATEQGPRMALERASWAPLIGGHRFVRVYPTVDCVRSVMSYTQFMNSELQLLAAQQNREINIMNTSRPGTDCAREERDMASATIEPGGLYVFLNWALHPGSNSRWKGNANCREFQHGVVCTRTWNGLETAALVDRASDFYAKLDPVPWNRRRAPRERAP